MLKLIKYELKKDMILYIILFGALFTLELVMLLSCLGSKEWVAAMWLFVCAGAINAVITFVMIYSVISYSRLIGSKASYLTFMTPNSAAKIIGAKYICLYTSVIIASVLLFLFVFLDVKVYISNFKIADNILEGLDWIFGLYWGKTVADLVGSAVVILIVIWLMAFAIIAIAFFGVTLSTTLLANKRGKGGLSAAFIIGFWIICGVIARNLPTIDSFIKSGDYSVGAGVLSNLPRITFAILLIAGSFIGSSALLEKKLSL